MINKINENMSFKGLQIKIASNRGIHTVFENNLIQEALPRLKELAKDKDILIKSAKVNTGDSECPYLAYGLKILITPLKETRSILNKIFNNDRIKDYFYTDQRPYMMCGNYLKGGDYQNLTETTSIAEYIENLIEIKQKQGNVTGFTCNI